jgi:hypothetical protein
VAKNNRRVNLVFEGGRVKSSDVNANGFSASWRFDDCVETYRASDDRAKTAAAVTRA